VLHSRVGSDLIRKPWTRLKRLARDKHSFITKIRKFRTKKFYNIGPRSYASAGVIKFLLRLDYQGKLFLLLLKGGKNFGTILKKVFHL
jgi:hypothetical protein